MQELEKVVVIGNTTDLTGLYETGILDGFSKEHLDLRTETPVGIKRQEG